MGLGAAEFRPIPLYRMAIRHARATIRSATGIASQNAIAPLADKLMARVLRENSGAFFIASFPSLAEQEEFIPLCVSRSRNKCQEAEKTESTLKCSCSVACAQAHEGQAEERGGDCQQDAERTHFGHLALVPKIEDHHGDQPILRARQHYGQR